LVELLSLDFDVDFRNCGLVVDLGGAHSLEVDVEQVDSSRVSDHRVLIPLA